MFPIVLAVRLTKRIQQSRAGQPRRRESRRSRPRRRREPQHATRPKKLLRTSVSEDGETSPWQTVNDSEDELDPPPSYYEDDRV